MASNTQEAVTVPESFRAVLSVTPETRPPRCALRSPGYGIRSASGVPCSTAHGRRQCPRRVRWRGKPVLRVRWSAERRSVRKRDRFPAAEPCQRRGEKVGRAADFLQEFLRWPHVGQVAAAFAGDPDFPLRLFHLFADQDTESGLCGYPRSHDPGGPSARYDKVEILNSVKFSTKIKFRCFFPVPEKSVDLRSPIALRKMLSRRLLGLRLSKLFIRILSRVGLLIVSKNLLFSIDKTYELYHRLLCSWT